MFLFACMYCQIDFLPLFPFAVQDSDTEVFKPCLEGGVGWVTGNWLQKVFDSEETASADKMLAVAAVIVEEMRAAILRQTGFHCSAGIAHNKVTVLQ